MLKYIELDGKTPKHTLDIFSTDHTNYQDAAILLNDKVVVVDFDRFTDIGDLIYRKYPTLRVHTSRGYHLYYRKPKTVTIKNWTQRLTNIGVTVDYKTGSRSLSVIKQNGQMRQMDQGELLGDWGRLPDLPFELYPHRLKQLLHGLKDGDGRNSYMYSHLLTMREIYPKADIQTIRNIAHFINAHVFADPLKEIDTVISSALSKNVQEQQFLDPKDIIRTSQILSREFEIKYYNRALYFKTDNGWISDDNKLLRAVDKRIKLKPRQQNELLKRLETDSELIEQDSFPIRFNNGWMLDEYDVIPMESDFTPFNLDVAYNVDAYDEHVDSFLDFITCNRKDLRTVLEEMFGHILMTHGFPHKAFFLAGESGANGKSTLLEMLNSFVGDLGNTLSLEDFNEPFHIATLDGKLVNIGDDIDAAYLDRSKNFKTLVSGNTISVRRMYGEPFKLKNKATLIFTCNEMPTFKDKSGGIVRRIVVIPCDNKVTKVDPNIDKKLSTDRAKSYLLNLAIAGMQRIIDNGGISYSQTIEEATNRYFAENDSVLSYLLEYDIDGKTVDTVYLQYQMYCEDAGLKPVGKIQMGRRINAAGFKTKIVKVKGKSRRVYERMEEVTDVS